MVKLFCLFQPIRDISEPRSRFNSLSDCRISGKVRRSKTDILSTELRRQRNLVSLNYALNIVKFSVTCETTDKFVHVHKIYFHWKSTTNSVNSNSVRNILHARLLTYADLMLTRHVRRIGVADKQTQHGKQRVDAKIHYRSFSRGVAEKRSMSTEFILQSRRRPFCHDPARSRFQIRR